MEIQAVSKDLSLAAHPIRLAVLHAALGDRILTAKDLAEELDQPLGNVSYHVAELRAAGLLEVVETVAVRGAVSKRLRAVPRARPLYFAVTGYREKVAELEVALANGGEIRDGLEGRGDA